MEDEQRRLENVETLRETYERAYYELYEGVRDEPGLVSRLESLVSDLAKAARVDRRAQPATDQFQEAAIVLRDLSREFRELADACDVDPQRLSEVTARLDLVNAEAQVRPVARRCAGIQRQCSERAVRDR